MYDNEMMIRSGASNMTGTETGSYIATKPGHQDLEFRVVVPDLFAANDKISVAITLSDDGTNAKEVLTMPDITYANVHTNGITEYFMRIPMTRNYIKAVFTCTDADSGGDFNAGKVVAGLQPAGRYINR